MANQIVSSDDARDQGDPAEETADEATVKELMRDSRPLWFIVLPLLLLLGAGTAIYLTVGDSETPTEDASEEPTLASDAPGADESGAAISETTVDSDGGTTEGDEQAVVVTVETDGRAAGLPTPPTDAPYVDATLTDNVFVLSGVVPDEEIKAALEASAEVAYAPFHTSELSVDPSIDPTEWLATAPSVIGLIPMITDGTIRLQDDTVTLVGRSPRQEWADDMAGVVGALTGLPVSNDGIEVTNLVPPRFVATVNDGQVLLEGEIPSQQLIETYIGGAAAVYGADNVTSTMTVDEGTYTSFWNYTMPGVLQMLQPFPSYKIQVEEAVLSGNMQGAVLFESNSDAITPEAEQVLPLGIALMARDLTLHMTVIGHTDSLGPDELNQVLSQQRAESVVGFFTAAGLDPARLTAEGRGSSDPIASNDTADGRALNRRVEFLFGPIDRSAGG